jgi:predicted nucleic acid-binding protein
VIVLDASAIVELLLRSTRGSRVRQRLNQDHDLHAPHLLDIEVMHAFRRLVRSQYLEPGRGALALEDFRDLNIRRYPHVPLMSRIWALRHNFSAYDATYVALAEALRASMITCDERLASAPGAGTQVELI